MPDKSKKKKEGSGSSSKDQSKSTDEFDADSTRFCEACKRDVRIGFGGEANWQQHLKSSKHRLKAPVPTAQGIKNFFTRIVSSAKPTISSSPSAASLKTQPLPSLSLESEVIDVDASGDVRSPGVPDKPLWLVLSSRLRCADSQLPQAVPLGVLTDAFAEISGNPMHGVVDVEEAWEEHLNPSLHRVFGYDSSVESLVGIVRRGTVGLEGFGDWVEAIGQAGVDVEMLRERVEKLLEAARIVAQQHGVQLQYPDQTRPLEPSNLDDIPPPLEPIRSASPSSSPARPASIDLDDIPPPLEPIPKRSKPVALAVVLFTCLGYRMVFPDGASPYLSYPFAIHDIQALPWNVAIINPGPQLYLRSLDCAGQSTRPTGASCRKLENHSVIMGIRHRNLDGTHKNTPWAYLSIAQLFDWLKRKTSQIDALHLDGLNRGRLIAVRVRHLDGWRRLVMSIINNEIPRIRVALAVQERNGAGVFGYLRAVDSAAKQAYKPKSYQEADFQRAYLIWKLGGVSAANIAHRTLGTPSIDSTRRNMTVNHIRASSGFPTVNELVANLRAAFEDWAPMAATGPSGPLVVYGASVSSDELKIQERLRWEAFLNTILGLCREHSSGLCLDFRSLRQADVVLEALKAVPQRVHFASEFSTVSSKNWLGASYTPP
ncbi:uncharacterized protein STEHIDRAFT_160759 [Stereum hirsutum FP-91666 SS1]|uniref:uncharacterized protein n=1 Tax=Stereum hirsutum (strain FP-91666) TaxID=721885 RepID=UPI000444A67A|nr:uncharacterized protein STEHIDRAFT_160759 [Stereum hirsutum FP-91666 SS1]EIM82196.1 hypothetical protein STEHIDRAFT_160759 [Stereum hirsutum FP-91666 SS1]